MIEEFRGSNGSDFDTPHERKHDRSKSLGCQRAAILIQRTDQSLIIEEFGEPTGSDFDTAHERKHDD